jgi:pimeloyl-ACP methyl ester carboxylesterase
MKLPESGALVRSIRLEPKKVSLALAGSVALGTAALMSKRQSDRAETCHPPAGRFLEVDGVRLHYIELGSGEPLVLIHGNGTQIEDFATSGLIDLAAETHRVLAFDRPGFGHSSRPRNRIWTPFAQASLLHKALSRLGVENCTVLGHSWGALVAIALALRHPPLVEKLVLVSGFYYPTDRFDATLQFVKASTGVGDLWCYTIGAPIARLGWHGLTEKMFFPAAVPQSFTDAVKEMALRPSQLRASAAESALMIPTVAEMQHSYRDLVMPVSIVVGANDSLISACSQSMRLHDDIAGSALHVVEGLGHMVHHGGCRAVMNAVA